MSAGSVPAETVVDEFVSAHLGRPVWRFTQGQHVSAAEVIEAAREAAVGLISARTTADDDEAGEALINAGFRPVGTLVTFRLDLDTAKMPNAVGIRSAAGPDQERCADIGGSVLRANRFHTDPRFPEEIASELKADWVRNAFAGRADRILVCDESGKLDGFNLCLWRPPIAVIDLIAVAARAQGKGIASRLIAAMAEIAVGLQLEAIEAGTQMGNAPSFALYESLGFKVTKKQIDYHWTP